MYPTAAGVFHLEQLKACIQLYSTPTRTLHSTFPPLALSDQEKNLIEVDLGSRKKEAHFEAMGPNLWNLTSYRRQTRRQNGEEMVGAYVRLKRGAAGTYRISDMV